ncbi:non-hydrolyzing UDP-N-acetylglucosamine 2-epimerase [Pseudodesulfovibrio sediminis]|uniref:UDP-N-acetyl glucosamine 2-epimerase n=1 Tax=Pseudodesulfovibrio sediminis TaxID=2810563 RepID=A0ABN6EUM0_9BACT|nr:UDP-N-acetylglucosamine 2-epimerase (non-hydrolyzing) [Pseudodesulfovibrio sediminis]BCS89175.1 UDP-N-acetyl glucosamine 2-epimerase [Pseudodesulfovibrio sediminis]
MKIVTILGARPQFVKASALSRGVAALNREGNSITESIVHTGQHYDIDMSDVFFSELNIPRPKLKLAASASDRTLRFSEMLAGLSPFLLQEKPDVVLVFGDTDTTLAGALAASHLSIPVAHVEAGLRSFNTAMPEETNRVLTDHMASYLFCPTTTAITNLAHEGIADSDSIKVVQCGDIQLETLKHYAQTSEPNPALKQQLDTLAGENGQFALVTLHRAENTSDRGRLSGMLDGIRKVAKSLPVVFPVHPGTRKKMQEFGLPLEDENILLLHPVGFLDMIGLLKRASLVMTDSGGLQKEAYFLQTPCVTLRRETEWVELVEHGFNDLAGVEAESIATSVKSMLNKQYDWGHTLYGKGDTSHVILETLIRSLNK